MSVALFGSEGTLTVDESRHSLKHVIAFSSENPFDEEQVDISILFASTEVDTAVLKETFGLQQLAADSALTYVLVSFSDDHSGGRSLQSCQIQAGDFSVQISGSTPLESTMSELSLEKVKGRLFNEREGSFSGVSWSFSAEVDDSVRQVYVPSSQRAGTEIAKGGGELGAIYLAYGNAIRDGDIDALIGFLTGDRREMAESEEFETMLPDIQEMLPQNVEIEGGKLFGDDAELYVNAQMEGSQVSGTVVMKKESGKWKVANEKWAF